MEIFSAWIVNEHFSHHGMPLRAGMKNFIFIYNFYIYLQAFSREVRLISFLHAWRLSITRQSRKMNFTGSQIVKVHIHKAKIYVHCIYICNVNVFNMYIVTPLHTYYSIISKRCSLISNTWTLSLNNVCCICMHMYLLTLIGLTWCIGVNYVTIASLKMYICMSTVWVHANLSVNKLTNVLW